LRGGGREEKILKKEGRHRQLTDPARLETSGRERKKGKPKISLTGGGKRGATKKEAKWSFCGTCVLTQPTGKRKGKKIRWIGVRAVAPPAASQEKEKRIKKKKKRRKMTRRVTHSISPQGPVEQRKEEKIKKKKRGRERGPATFH